MCVCDRGVLKVYRCGVWVTEACPHCPHPLPEPDRRFWHSRLTTKRNGDRIPEYLTNETAIRDGCACGVTPASDGEFNADISFLRYHYRQTAFVDCGSPVVMAGERNPISQQARFVVPGRNGLSTSKLQRLVSQMLGERMAAYTIHENIRPAWLIGPLGERLELDFYIEELEIAIEVQGQQHYAYVPHFHKSYDAYLKRKAFDQAKRETCERIGIALYEITDDQEAEELLSKISEKRAVKNKPVNTHDDKDWVLIIQRTRAIVDALARTVSDADYLMVGPDYGRAVAWIVQFQHVITTDLSTTEWTSIVELLKRAFAMTREARVMKKNKVLPKIAPKPTPIPKSPKLSRSAQTNDSDPKPAREARVKTTAGGRMTLTPYPCTKGSYKRAMSRYIKPVDSKTWVVWGGEAEHKIEIIDGQPTCDCRGFTSGETKACSHIIRYYMAVKLNRF